MKCIRNADVADRVENFQSFSNSTGTLYGVDGRARAPQAHYLFPRELYDRHGDSIAYTVMSYDTPIAWFVADIGWVIPAVKYSVTTSRHQGYVKRGAGDWTADGRSEGETNRSLFDPDNGAPIDYEAGPYGLVNSGEGAIYSLEYLSKKHQRQHA